VEGEGGGVRGGDVGAGDGDPVAHGLRAEPEHAVAVHVKLARRVAAAVAAARVAVHGAIVDGGAVADDELAVGVA
jgi:hypothetical protein